MDFNHDSHQTGVDIIPEYTPYKLHKTNSIAAGAFFGGPIAGALLMAENFKMLGQKKQARTTLILGISAVLALSIAVVLIPGMEKTPNYVIPLISAFIFQFLVKRFQKEEIEAHIEHGGQTFSFWRTAGIILISIIIALVMIIIPLFLFDTI